MLNNIGEIFMDIVLEVLTLFGVPAIISTVIPFLIKRRLDKNDKKKDDIEDLKESRKEYEKNQKELLDTVRRMEERFTLYEDSILSLLRERIIQTYNHYMDKQKMPIYARESLDRMRRDYNELNKDDTDTIDTLLEQLYKLPTEY